MRWLGVYKTLQSRSYKANRMCVVVKSKRERALSLPRNRRCIKKSKNIHCWPKTCTEFKLCWYCFKKREKCGVKKLFNYYEAYHDLMFPQRGGLMSLLYWGESDKYLMKKYEHMYCEQMKRHWESTKQLYHNKYLYKHPKRVPHARNYCYRR